MIREIPLIDGSTKKIHLAGWKRDRPDARDYKLRSLSSSLPRMASPRPASVDNSHFCSGIEDQGELGSCTAHMFAGMVEYNDIRFAPAKPDRTRVSRLFEYYATRKIEGTVSEDAGAQIRDAIKSGAQYGVLKESLWWYNPVKFAVEPPKKIWEAAQKKIVASYHRIEDGDLETMKQTLAAGYVIGFGFLVYDNIYAYAPGMVLQKGTTDVIGGHAVVLVGYDDVRRAFKVRNSWGTGWGEKGYFWMSYDYVGDPNQANDFWVIDSAVMI